MINCTGRKIGVFQEIQTRILNIQKLREKIASALNISESAGAVPLFDAKKLSGRTQKQLRVAAIMDRFTLDCFRPECELTELTPEGWRQEVEQARPDLLFIESAWEGKDGLWHGKINHCSAEVRALAEFCHEHEIPVVFWNKEDPIYTDVFMETARLADVVFTTDIERIQKYKTELGHERVYHLHFAAQPVTHNPIEKYDRKDKFCFAGAYYHRYEQRCRVFDAFAEYFQQTRGLDIYDRNYPSPRPEHKFPEQYDPCILGRLDPSEIDVAYKGYRFGINMNSVVQSQTMFARRVFELLACNTVVIGNYSRGIKNYFGDLTICTDDAKTLKTAMEQYCADTDTEDRYRLLGLRKVLAEHLCEDRLDSIVKKVYGVSVKPALPLITVFARVQNEEEMQSVRSAFARQTYGNKQLVLVTETEVAAGKNERIVSGAQFDATPLREFCREGYAAYFAPQDWYGKNYLLDFALTTRYGDFDGIGKAAYFVRETMQQREMAYRPVEQLCARRAMLKAAELGDSAGEALTAETVWHGAQMLSVDAFNYCQDWAQAQCAHAEDLFVADQGIPLQKIEKTAEQIVPVVGMGTSVTVTAGEIAQTRISGTPLVQIAQEGTCAKITSALPEEQHYYIYLKNKISLRDLVEDGKVSVLFRGHGTLDLVCGCVFYDAGGKKLDVKYPRLGRREQIPVPAEASYLVPLYRPRGSGSAMLESIVFGKSGDGGSHGDCYLLRSNVLVLSNHYPSYDALYRNMFVHKRMMAYKETGHVFDVLRMYVYAGPQFREFEGINVIDGYREELAGVLASGQVDTVCVHFLDREMWEILKPFLGKIRLIVWLHGAEIQPWWRREYNYSTQAELEQAKQQSEERMRFWKEVFASEKAEYLHYVIVSQYFCDEIFEDYQIQLDPSQYSIIHNCIDTDQFSYIPKSEEQRKKILSIRPYQSNKYANDLSVKAIQALAGEPWFSELEIAMIGNGPLFDTLLAPLKKYPNVHLRKEFLSQNEIAALHKQYGIFLTPTRMDAQGVSRDEAMSSGLVPVTNAVTAVPEFVDEDCGILAPGEDYLAMAEGIKRLYHHPEEFLRMSANAAARVRRQTSKEYTIQKEVRLICGRNAD